MAHTKKKLEELAIKAIKKEKLTWITEVIGFIPCSRSTFYNKGLEQLDSIKDAIEQNRLSMKAQMKHKWFNSDNATLQIALMKLMADNEEWDKLNSSKSQVQQETTGSITFDFN
jgi:ACT domain-containing protein